jgi:polar amino acid transport system substrate-binding protein
MSHLNRRQFGLLAGGVAVAGLVAPGAAFAETALEKIKRTGVVTVGTEAAYPPFEFVKDGKIVGYGSDILAEVVKELGVKLNQLDLPWQGILPGVLAGKFDFVATTVGINEERAKRYAYTMPIANGMPYAMMRKGDKMTVIEDLNGKVVATQLASSTEPISRALDAKLKAAGGPGFKELKLFTAFTEAFVAVAAGSTYTYLAWVTRPDDLDLREFVNGVIRKMRDDGRLGVLQEKWFGFKMDIPDSGYLPPGAV